MIAVHSMTSGTSPLAPPNGASAAWISSSIGSVREPRRAAEVADIESPRFRVEGEHDLVCVFYFLHRPLFAEIRRAVRPGGLFVAAIHARSGPNEEGRLLREPGELSGLFSGWEIVHAREGAAAESNHRHGAAELIARKPR